MFHYHYVNVNMNESALLHYDYDYNRTIASAIQSLMSLEFVVMILIITIFFITNLNFKVI